MGFVSWITWFYSINRCQLRFQGNVIQRSLLFAEAAIYRIGTGNVGGVMFIFTAGIYQYQIAIAQCGSGLGVVQDTAVGTAANDCLLYTSDAADE